MKPLSRFIEILSVAFFVLFFQYLADFFRQSGLFSGLCNSHAFWGIPLQTVFFWILSLAAIIGILFLWWNEPVTWTRIPLVLLGIAGLSNIVERIRYGCVYDYLSLPYLPESNIPDILLTVAVLLFFWTQFKKNKK